MATRAMQVIAGEHVPDRASRRASAARRARAVVLRAFCAVTASGITACALDGPLHAATGFTAHSLCTERFVAG